MNNNWVLLDSQSTVNQVSNQALHSNIRKSKNPLVIHCNGEPGIGEHYIKAGLVRYCQRKLAEQSKAKLLSDL